jgi:hypothetical protein
MQWGAYEVFSVISGVVLNREQARATRQTADRNQSE